MAKQNDVPSLVTLTEEGKRNLEQMKQQLAQSEQFLQDAQDLGFDNTILRRNVEQGKRMIDLLQKQIK